jgi:hypothetical protein
LNGHWELVDVIVFRGPDSALRSFARIKPSVTAAGASFQLQSVPPGGYIVTLLGRGGSSLKINPPLAQITVAAGSESRTSFTIDAAQ